MTAITITRQVTGDLDRVWRAWTDDGELAAWMWPPTFRTRCAIDLRVGGGFRISSETVGMAVSGEYTAIDRPDELGFTWRWDGESEVSEVRVRLREIGDGVRIDIVHDGLPSPTARDDHAQGWNDCLDRLPGHLRSTGTVAE